MVVVPASGAGITDRTAAETRATNRACTSGL
jgi:hypothetical protein